MACSFSSKVICSYPENKIKKSICGQGGVFIVFSPSKYTDSKDLEIILLQPKDKHRGSTGGKEKKLLKNIGFCKNKMCKQLEPRR